MIVTIPEDVCCDFLPIAAVDITAGKTPLQVMKDQPVSEIDRCVIRNGRRHLHQEAVPNL
jgi:hypothetical protein